MISSLVYTAKLTTISSLSYTQSIYPYHAEGSMSSIMIFNSMQFDVKALSGPPEETTKDLYKFKD